MVSPFLKMFFKSEIADENNFDECIEMIDTALSTTSHLARIRSVAKAAGFCAYYSRMAEKMGVLEVLEGPSVGKGRTVHRILSLASLKMFSEKTNPSYHDVENYIDDSISALGIEVDDNTRDVAKRLLERLITVLPKARDILRLSQQDALFPIVEQQFMDFKDRMYGAPDLILESLERKKAIVIEWKTYSIDNKGKNIAYSDYEKAQVVAYSILEARRLRIKKYNDVFKAISGLSLERVDEITKRFDNGTLSNSDILKILDEAKRNIRILPIIVGPSGGYHPSPFPELYPRADLDSIVKRFKKLYDLFQGVIIAAEFLTLQIANIPELLKATIGGDVENTLRGICKSGRGNYPVYSYTPFRYLRAGKPGAWDRYPCRICPFRGDGGPCDFYFGSTRTKDYFDKLMWWARYIVFSERERDLINYMAMHILLTFPLTRKYIIEKSLTEPREFKVVIGRRPHAKFVRRKWSIPIVNTVHVYRGEEEEGRFRFEVFRVRDIEVVDESLLRLMRPLRDIEKENDLIGVLRRSVVLSIINPEGGNTDPTLSINTFVFFDDDVGLEGDNVIYLAYTPSPILQYSFKLFSHYIRIYKDRGIDAFVIAFEAPVDLTIMELRAIDATHRYIKSDQYIESMKEVAVQYNISDDDIKREREIVEGFSPKRNDIVGEPVVLKLRELLKERIMKVGD